MEVSRQAQELPVLGETRNARHQAGLAALTGGIPELGRIDRSKEGNSSLEGQR